MENKPTMPEIIGYLCAGNTIIEIELKVALEVYGENIPAYHIKAILENLQKRIKTSDEAWENRAS